MEQRTFEGTWEEILLHASELIGQRVKLTVLSNVDFSLRNKTTLDQVLKNRVGRVHFQPSNLSERTGEAFANLLADKYKSSGLSQ
jgi:hypothetical protein